MLQLHTNLAKVVIDNEDDSYNLFVKLLMTENKIKNINQLRCYRTCPPPTIGNKIKKVQIRYEPHEGEYLVDFQDKQFRVVCERGEVKVTTQYRKLEQTKKITIYGETLDLIQQFVNYVFNLSNDIADTDTITIYQNTNGSWRTSKEKKPRKLETVFLKESFKNSIIEDIRDFIESESWYTKMGIPYKRSYLLYGPPGTGKSSLAQALAAEIKYSICFVNCSDKINDYQFNYLLNTAPLKSVILIEDVDSIFSERKNVEKLNMLTFSGFLNAIDGVRSQEGRIIILTTNYKERLDPALLRPGRVDQMYEISLATRYQIQKMCFRFFEDASLAKQFAQKLPEGKFSMSMIQGFLIRYRKNPKGILIGAADILECDENIKIDQFLAELNCSDCLNDFKIEECYTLSSAKNLPRTEIEKVTSKLSSLLRGRLMENIRADRKTYIKSPEAIEKYIEEVTHNEELQRQLRLYCKENFVNTYFLIKDKLKQLTEKYHIAEKIKE